MTDVLPLESESGVLPAATPHWWKSKYRLYNAVFEGGGAKGIAYVGALQAVEEEGIWFRRVAGASVGSIIAALVASGLSVTQFQHVMREVLGMFEPFQGRKSIMRLRKQNAIFEFVKLRAHLDELFRSQVDVHQFERADPNSPVTFYELFEAIGIELAVMAVDISERREVVFTHKSTPHCQVVDAVLASSSIPGFFPPGRLLVEKSPTLKLAHPIVDGGVWANFPLFVYLDDRFRAFHDLEELEGDERQTIGFLLEESLLVTTPQRRSRYFEPLTEARFWQKGDAVLPAEVTIIASGGALSDLISTNPPATTSSGKLESSAYKRFVVNKWLLPWTWARSVGRRSAFLEDPEVASRSSAELYWLSLIPIRSKPARLMRFSAHLFRSPTGAWIYFTGLVLACLALWIAVHQIGDALDAFSGEGSGWITAVAVVYFVTIGLVVLPLAIVAFLGSIGLLLGNLYLSRMLERYGYLLGSTLASAGSVRYWMDPDPDSERLVSVIRIPIPDDLSTMSFQYADVNNAIALAHATAKEQLTAQIPGDNE